MDEALRRIGEMLGNSPPDWRSLVAFLPAGLQGLVFRSAVAATFSATLELVRAGRAELRQDGTFGPIYLKSRDVSSQPTNVSEGV